jgi:hypothetical protein
VDPNKFQLIKRNTDILKIRPSELSTFRGLEISFFEPLPLYFFNTVLSQINVTDHISCSGHQKQRNIANFHYSSPIITISSLKFCLSILIFIFLYVNFFEFFYSEIKTKHTFPLHMNLKIVPTFSVLNKTA